MYAYTTETERELPWLKMKGEDTEKPGSLPDAIAEENIKVATEERSILSSVDKAKESVIK
jgi:hypothetical protein